MKKKYIVIGIIFVLSLGVFLSFYYKDKKLEEPIIKEQNNNEEERKLKEAKYTPEEMLSFFKGEASIDDVDAYYDIVLNWYDYYSDDTLFINRHGEIYSKDEYMKIRENRSEYGFKTSMPIIKKINFTPILTSD